MNVLGTVIFFSWVPVSVLLFAAMPPRRAVIVSTLGAALFLPVAKFGLPGLPDYTKTSATSIGLLLGTMIFAPDRLLALRPRWFDLPMLAWCLVPLPSSISNDLGAYDGASAVLNHVMSWGLPYLMGRAHLGDADGVRELALGLVVGGLVYVPLCLWEVRMSPNLHAQVYGFAQRKDFGATIRYGGYRPQVFTSSGLELSMYMAGASLVAYWAWASGAIKGVAGRPSGPLALLLVATSVLCKSTGAILQMALGVAVLWIARRSRSALPALALAAIAPLYCGLRASGIWDGRGVVALTAASAGADRAESLEFRLDNEDRLIAKARQRPTLGWGGWGRARVFSDEGKDLTVTDGLWIIALGNYGAVGLTSQVAVLTLPLLLLASRVPARRWKDPDVAPAAAIAVLLALYMIDNLSNAMFNPIYYLAAGALASPGAWSPGDSIPESGSGSAGESDPDRDSGAILEARREAECLEASATAGPRGWADVAIAWAEVARLEAGRPRVSPVGLAEALGRRGLCLARLGLWREASEARTRAVEVLTSAAPGDPGVDRLVADARNDLAWLLVIADDPGIFDPSRAVELASSASRLAPDHHVYQNTLGAALVRSGRPSEGIAAIARSMALGNHSGSAFDLLLLALAHASLGEAEAARVTLEAADSRAADTLDRPEWNALRREVAKRSRGDGGPLTGGAGT